jgi:peptidoglycan/xylan/chitin deacetylase (PgdA/CDA1 family)
MQQLIKAALRSAAARTYWASPHFLRHVTGKVLILAYHRVIPRADTATTFVQPGMYVTPTTFERHLRFLTAHFDLLGFDDLLARWDAGKWDDKARYAVITFDDGWLDNLLYAFPLLRAYRVPATIFLPTDLIGTCEWLWSDRLGYLLHRLRCSRDGVPRDLLAPLVQRYPALGVMFDRRTSDACDAVIESAKSIPDKAREALVRTLEEASGARNGDGRRLLNWDEVREMSRDGIAFGSHTCTHPILTRLESSALTWELRRPLEILRRQRVNCVPVLSYPNGTYSDAVLAEARAAGYRAAVTTRSGLESSSPSNLFALRRVGVHDDVTRSPSLFAFHIARHAQPRTRTA